MLFVCTGNSIRSQMAEGLLRDLAGDRFEAVSAGTHPGVLHPAAVAAMREIGVDIADQRAKSVAALVGQPFDHVITVCDHARRVCPGFPGVAADHWSVEDPTASARPGEDRAAAFRRVRDDLAARIRALVAAGGEDPAPEAARPEPASSTGAGVPREPTAPAPPKRPRERYNPLTPWRR